MLIDPFGRRISYLRLSVTDRCDLRCTYCMTERMRFLPKKDLLSIDELERLASAFVERGVRKIRLTGGEPLVRSDVLGLVTRLGRFLGTGELDELVMTTNGSRLEQFAPALADAGVRRLNVSLDSLDPATYARITRGGDLLKVIRGIDAALACGMRVKINAVALLHDNLDQLVGLCEWAHARGLELSVIEVMPLGDVDADRMDQFVPLSEVRRRFEQRWSLVPDHATSGGPARYWRTDEGGRIGFISPLSDNFCASCNRVRVTCTGTLYPCLGHERAVDLRAALRSSPTDELVHAAIDRAIAVKPERHFFAIDRRGTAPAVPRHMSVTGG